jgi:hypothetical protein
MPTVLRREEDGGPKANTVCSGPLTSLGELKDNLPRLDARGAANRRGTATVPRSAQMWLAFLPLAGMKRSRVTPRLFCTQHSVACLPAIGHAAKHRRILRGAKVSIRPSAGVICLHLLSAWQLQFAWRPTAWRDR